MGKCQICDKHKEVTPVYQGEHSVVSPVPFNKGVLGYLYIEPVRHVENWYELTKEEFNEISKLISKISKFLKEELDADRVYTVSISESVRHLHIHLIPRERKSNLRGINLIEHATQGEVYPVQTTHNKYVDLLNRIYEYLH
ncbi:HIT family protein [Bacillus sp. P14.5]|uniref:HIT family protein n=1 Tax=Bacillus sp. P14.5 TaxID=1983400 RepID=UPI000DEAB94D|nr:HIT family protein [Bacillus sp. P14.5]